MLFNRDFSILSDREQKQLDYATNYLEIAKSKEGGTVTAKVLNTYHELLPIAFYHFNSLFPNNYIIQDFKRHNGKEHDLFEGFKTIIENNNSNESDILKYIKNSESYFILESLLGKYSTGHHDAYLFREFGLPPDFFVDFLLVGKSSDGFEFIFIEFESPNEEIVLKDGSLGRSFRKGIKQVEDWDEWIDASYSSLKNVFKKIKNKSRELPSEFYELDKTRIHYLVIAGRRKMFNDKTYRLKRKSRNSIHIMHYDNLIDQTQFYLDSNIRK